MGGDEAGGAARLDGARATGGTVVALVHLDLTGCDSWWRRVGPIGFHSALAGWSDRGVELPGVRASGGRHRRHVHGTKQVGGSAWVSARGRFRAGVEGLRAVAILAVVLYHAGLGAAGGGYVGVDIFLRAAGLSDHGPVVGRAGAHRTAVVRLVRLVYARRARRLLPAAMLVVATMVALLVALPAAVVLPPLVGLAGLVLTLAA